LRQKRLYGRCHLPNSYLWRAHVIPVCRELQKSCRHRRLIQTPTMFPPSVRRKACAWRIANLVWKSNGPAGCVRSVVAESVLLKHQLLIVNRSRHRAPNLGMWDRLIAACCSLCVKPTRLARAAHCAQAFDDFEFPQRTRPAKVSVVVFAKAEE
jgi:hypothetical protein